MGKNAQRRHRAVTNSPIMYQIGLEPGSGAPVVLNFTNAATGQPRLATVWTPDAAEAIAVALLSTVRMARSWASREPVPPAILPKESFPTAKGSGGAVNDVA